MSDLSDEYSISRWIFSSEKWLKSVM